MITSPRLALLFLALNCCVLPGCSESGERPGSPPPSIPDDTNVIGAPVPEPTTLLLVGSGLVGIAFYRRRGRRTSARE